jgi:hypothetical protein
MHSGQSLVPYGCTYLLLWGRRFMVKQQNVKKLTFYANKSVDGLQLSEYLADFGKWGTILIVTSLFTLSMPYFTSEGHFSDLLRCSKVRQLKVAIVTLRSDQQGDILFSIFYSPSSPVQRTSMSANFPDIPFFANILSCQFGHSRTF